MICQGKLESLYLYITHIISVLSSGEKSRPDRKVLRLKNSCVVNIKP